MNDVAAVRELLAGTPEGADASPQQMDIEDDTGSTEQDALENVEVEGEGVEQSLEGDEALGEAEAEGDDTTDSAEGEAGADEGYSVASLAEAIGWEASDLYDVDVPMGEGVEPVKLGALKDEYQKLAHENTQMQTEMEALKAQAGEVQDLTQVGAGVSQEMVAAFGEMENIKKAYESEDWAAQEQADPGAAALRKQKYQEAFQAAQGKVAQAEANMRAYKQQNLQRAAGQMFEMIPEWKDTDVRKADQDRIREVMRAEGYTDQVINGIGDPRAMKLLRELVTLRDKVSQFEAAGQVALGKVKKAPKVIGSRRINQTKSAQNRKVAELTKQARNAKPGQRRGAELAAAKALLGVR